jgi:hypothetical protein
MEPFLVGSVQASGSAKQEAFICCRGSFFLGGMFGVIAALGGVAIALTSLGLFDKASPEPPAPTGKTSTLGCTLESDVKILIVQGNTWEPDGGNEFLNAQQTCVKAQLSGTAASVGACMEKATNVSSQCGLVYGKLAVCMRDKCLVKCLATKMPHPKKAAKVECAQCICTNCRALELAETKLPCTLLPQEADPDQGCHDCFGHTTHWPPHL